MAHHLQDNYKVIPHIIMEGMRRWPFGGHMKGWNVFLSTFGLGLQVSSSPVWLGTVLWALSIFHSWFYLQNNKFHHSYKTWHHQDNDPWEVAGWIKDMAIWWLWGVLKIDTLLGVSGGFVVENWPFLMPAILPLCLAREWGNLLLYCV